MKRMSFLLNILLLVTIVAVFFHRAQSQGGEPIPPEAVSAPTSLLFSYQGQLLDAGGNPVTDSAVPMTFKLYTTATGGTACWTEERSGANAVEVENGRFYVLLGQITFIPEGCLTADAYLELTINNETLSPRQLLTSIAYAVESTTLSAGAITRGLVQLGGNLDMAAHSILNMGDRIETIAGNPNLQIMNEYGNVRLIAAGDLYFFMDSDNNSTNAAFILSRNNNRFDPPVETVFLVEESGETTITSDLNVNGWDINLGNSTVLRRDGRELHLLPWGGAGYAYDHVCIGCGSSANLIVNGNLNVNGSCSASIEGNEATTSTETCTAGRITTDSIQTGSVIEMNLMTPAEREVGAITRFEQGELLCWSATTTRLEKCNQLNDPLVQAVADSNGLPIVAGAEPIKVIGPVLAGDFLVASNVPGYAIATKNPTFGIVIAQALEDFDGKQGLILAMIRKM